MFLQFSSEGPAFGFYERADFKLLEASVFDRGAGMSVLNVFVDLIECVDLMEGYAVEDGEFSISGFVVQSMMTMII